jgi:hypothetical protein
MAFPPIWHSDGGRHRSALQRSGRVQAEIGFPPIWQTVSRRHWCLSEKQFENSVSAENLHARKTPKS